MYDMINTFYWVVVVVSGVVGVLSLMILFEDHGGDGTVTGCFIALLIAIVFVVLSAWGLDMVHDRRAANDEQNAMATINEELEEQRQRMLEALWSDQLEEQRALIAWYDDCIELLNSTTPSERTYRQRREATSCMNRLEADERATQAETD